MVQKSSDHQLRLVGYPIIYSVFFTFQVVVWDFWTINSIFLNWLVVYHPPPWNWVTHRISGFRLGPNDSHRGFFPWIEIPKSFCQQKKVCFSTTSSEPNFSAGQAFQNYSLRQWKIRHKFFFGESPKFLPQFPGEFLKPIFFSPRDGSKCHLDPLPLCPSNNQRKSGRLWPKSWKRSPAAGDFWGFFFDG